MPEILMAAQLNTAADLVLAVDAGGSKTAACFAQSLGSGKFHVLGRGQSTSGNPLSAGFDKAARAIELAIGAARTSAKLPHNPAAKAVLSVAGAANSAVAARIVKWAQDSRLADQIAVVSDILPILAAGSDDSCGIALISGTGSVTFGRARDGRTARCGGWGYLLGDEGSGYSIGRAALRLALAQLELANANPSPLVAAVLREFPANSPAELAKLIYNHDAPRSTIAAAAPLVTNAAEAGDLQAVAILMETAHDLVTLVARTAELLAFSDQQFSLAVAGGVLAGSPLLREQLGEQLAQKKLHAAIRVITDPLKGCLRLADTELGSALVEWH
jgi:glucosamine kinase